MFLNKERFQLSLPGPRTPLCGSFPQVPGAGNENAVASNHSGTVWGFFMTPFRSGRFEVLGIRLDTLWPANPIFNGAPEVAVTIPETSHPASALFKSRLRLVRKNGMRYTKLSKKLFLTSKQDGPKSYFHPS